jgi:hypothetical protein
MTRTLIVLSALLLAPSGCNLDGTTADSSAVDGFEDSGDFSGADAADEGDVCAPAMELTCGSRVYGDTSNMNMGTTDVLNGYAAGVGNYSGPELVFRFVAPTTGTVSFNLIDPVPTEVNHDLFVLDGAVGCKPSAAFKTGFNSLSFEADAGAEYFLVVDGFAGDAGAFQAKLECDGVDDGSDDIDGGDDAQPNHYNECAFGWQSNHIEAAPHLTTDVVEQYEAPEAVPAVTATQLMYGLDHDGWTDARNVDEAFKTIDSDGIYLNRIEMPATGEAFDHLEFYSGDTEVGYIFRAGTTQLVGLVSDGDIYECSVTAP